MLSVLLTHKKPQPILAGAFAFATNLEQSPEKYQDNSSNKSDKQVHNQPIVIRIIAQSLGNKTAYKPTHDTEDDIDYCAIVAIHETASQKTSNTADDNGIQETHDFYLLGEKVNRLGNNAQRVNKGLQY